MKAIIEPWIYRVAPYQGESLSHYLGRFRETNCLSVSRLAEEAGLGSVFIKRLEHFRHNPFPTASQLKKLAVFMEISPDLVMGMLPQKGMGMKLEPIRLCAACYDEVPYHRLEWQYKITSGCDKHRLRLLSECPKCKARFLLPSQWTGYCQRCGCDFSLMKSYQKFY